MVAPLVIFPSMNLWSGYLLVVNGSYFTRKSGVLDRAVPKDKICLAEQSEASSFEMSGPLDTHMVTTGVLDNSLKA